MVTQRARGASSTRRAPKPTRAEKAAERREQLLATALRLFVQHGYAATSTKRIAEAAGVAEGLVFHYFGSKDALLLEILSKQDTFAGRVLQLVQRATDGSARDLFHAIGAGYADVSPEEAELVGFFSAEAHVNPSLRASIAAGTAMVVNGFVELLGARVGSGEVRADASLSTCVYGFFGGFAFFFAQHRGLTGPAWRREAAAFSASWAEQCWRGIATPEALDARVDPAGLTASTTRTTRTSTTRTTSRRTRR